jgi:hypothetical protein
MYGNGVVRDCTVSENGAEGWKVVKQTSMIMMIAPVGPALQG